MVSSQKKEYIYIITICSRKTRTLSGPNHYTTSTTEKKTLVNFFFLMKLVLHYGVFSLKKALTELLFGAVWKIMWKNFDYSPYSVMKFSDWFKMFYKIIHTYWELVWKLMYHKGNCSNMNNLKSYCHICWQFFFLNELCCSISVHVTVHSSLV